MREGTSIERAQTERSGERRITQREAAARFPAPLSQSARNQQVSGAHVVGEAFRFLRSTKNWSLYDDEFFSLNLLAYPEKVGSLSELEAEVTASIG